MDKVRLSTRGEAMDDEIVFSTVSRCFAPIDKQEWDELVDTVLWSDFIDASRRLLQDNVVSGDKNPFRRMGSRCPLQDYLSDKEVSALFAPPSWEEKQSFAARHFTGGLPSSALPVESLYLPSGKPEDRLSAQGNGRLPGAYEGEPARYMRDLVARMGLVLPSQFSDCPDHLSVELDLLAVMLRSGMKHQADCFFKERFAWLSDYRLKLLSLPSNEGIGFYVGLIDVVMGIWLLRCASDEVLHSQSIV